MNIQVKPGIRNLTPGNVPRCLNGDSLCFLRLLSNVLISSKVNAVVTCHELISLRHFVYDPLPLRWLKPLVTHPIYKQTPIPHVYDS